MARRASRITDNRPMANHARWSASATERNWNCPGALAMSTGVPNKTGQAAAWGTCCHQIAEDDLRGVKPCAERLGEEIEADGHTFEIDEEMIETAQVYVDYVNERTAEAQAQAVDYAGAVRWIEKRLAFDSLNPPIESGGTADAVIYFPREQLLEVIDLKGGRGVVVEAAGNKQARSYALGALLSFALPVRYVKSTIVQPRAHHEDGPIRFETIHVVDLHEWTTDLLAAMRRAAEAEARRPQLADAEWSREYLQAGDHCKFCPAAGICPALEKRAYDLAGVWFDDLDKPHVANAPNAMSPEALARALDAADVIGEWINAVRRFATARAEGGVEIPGYQLVERIGNRRWKQADPYVVSDLVALGINDPYTKKLMSPAQVEKVLGKRKGEIADLVERPVTGTNLVRADKSTRAAVPAAVHRHFQPITN